MPTILDKMNQQESQPADLAAQAGTGTTQKLQQILQQTSGKQPTSGPATQNFAEQAAVGQAVTSAKGAEHTQQLNEAQLANQAAGQQASQRAATASTTQQVGAANQQYADAASQIMSKYEQSGQQLDMQKDAATANQLAFNMRLSNQEYTTRLSQEGQLRRLQDATSFQEQTANAVMGQELGALSGHLDWETAMTGNQDQWNQDLQNVSLNEWMTMSKYAAQTANVASTAQGAVGIGTGAAMAYGSSKPSADPETPDEQDPDTSTGVGPSTADNFNGPSKDLAPTFVGPPSGAAGAYPNG